MSRKAIFLFLLFATLLPAQSPERPPHSKIDWSLLVADVSVRSLDVYSTHRALSEGYQERFLPSAVADHVPSMAAYSGAMVFVDYLILREFEPHHPRLARIAVSADVVRDGYGAIHNLVLLGQGPSALQPPHGIVIRVFPR